MEWNVNSLRDILRILILTLLFLGFAAGTAGADFSFQGYTYNETNATLNNTNVSIEIYTMGGPFGPTLVGTNYTSSDATGYFNIWINGSLDQVDRMYKPVLKHFENNATTGNLDWIGQSLPQFPNQMISTLTAGSPMNFYLRKGGTIYLNASGLNQSQIVVPFAFKYVIKDTRMGYPVAQNFSAEQMLVGPLYVPLERNYSIMIFPNESLPVSYDLNNLSTFTDHTANITFNTSIRPLWVSGYANLSGGISNFTDFKIITYLMEPGNMVGKDHPMPSNMSAFRGPGFSDNYTASTGFYNITLPGSAQGSGANILLFATAFNSTNSQYYGAFKNITMSYSGSDLQNINFTLYPLLGSPENISVNDMGLFGQPRNITTKMLPFQLINGSSTTNYVNSFAHIEMQVNYSANGSAVFKWMLDVSQGINGAFSIPAISANINKINVFMQDFAPLKTSKNTTQLAAWPVNISMTSFENKKPDGGQLLGIRMDMLMSKPECDRPNPAQGCSLIRGQGQNQSEFNPIKVVMGGGKISMRIIQAGTGIKVHYKNVDLLASGPPDVLFEDNASSSQSGTALEQAWRFGSKGPEIYDEVLIGIPLGNIIPNNISVELGKLYDENWNTIWNISAGGTVSNLPSDYSTFNTSWFNSTTGMPCSTSDQTRSCYVDITNRTVWLTIPHFSGVGPTVSGTAGNFTATLTNSTGIAGGSVAMNFTMNDTLNYTSWYNITFPGFDASGAIVNITINSSADPQDWSKTSGTGYVNVSSGTATANFSLNQYINISNITVPGTAGNKTINVITSNGVTVSLNYTVVNYGVNLTVNPTSGTTNATVNMTYTLTLQNNGTATDTYNLTVTSVGASTSSLNNTSNIILASNAIRVLLLNVTNTSEGTSYVNVTARSLGDPAKVSYVNTTTTITAAPVWNVSLANISALQKTTNTSSNATYVLNLTNTGTVQDTYTLALSGDSPTVAALNISSVTIAAGASSIFSLNVTNSANGTFHVNVTATSQGNTSKVAYVNTTTYVHLFIPGTPTSYWGYVTVGGILKSATINVTAPDGSDVGNTTSFSNGSYRVEVKRNDSNPGNPGVIAGQTINFNVNGVPVHSRTVDGSGSSNRLDLALYNGSLAGSVLKNGTNIGISGATVNISNATLGSTIVTTDTLGTYRVMSLYPAIYTISVSKTGYSNNSTTATITSNASTSSVILLSQNTVTVTADMTVGTADVGQNVTFNLTVVNTGVNATFSVTNVSTNVTNVTTTPSSLLLNTITPTGYVVVQVNNGNLGGWPVTVTISNSSQSKSASITLNAIMRNSSANYTCVNCIVTNSTITGATLVNTTVQDNATVSGNSTLIMNTTVTGESTVITNGTVIKGTYVDSYIDNSTIGNATVDSSNLTDSIARNNASITNSTLTGATVDNSTLNYVTVTGGVTITNVAGLSNITLNGVTVTGDPSYDYEGKISAGTGWVNYLNINFTNIYADVRISQLVIDQGADVIVPANTPTGINDTGMGISMTVNVSRSMRINISETFINPDGAGFSSGTKIGNFLVIRSNDTNATNVTNNTLRLYFDTDPATYTGGVAINYYNTATSAWEALTTIASGTENGRWYVEAAPNHFGTFALLGTTTTGGGDGGGGGNGGGGGGGGGGKSAENSSNIEVIEKYDLQISKDTLTSYRFTHAKNPIMFVNITGNTSLGIITASIEVLKNTSTLVTVPPVGLVYMNANIWVGTSGFATPKNIKEALIKFRIDNAWMSANGVLASDIVLMKWDGTSWINLETKVLPKDNTNSYFEGKTNSFSPFAIVAKTASTPKPTATTPAPTATPVITATATPAPGEEGGIPTWIIVLVILVIIGAGAYYFLVVKKNE